ncbi:MAG: TM0106 family RecB-like putative nuclease [Candidatus Baltobacteraceae bacterium]
MQKLDGRLIFSPSDLHRYLECRTLTALDLSAVDEPGIAAPLDPQSELLVQKGRDRERRYLASLERHERVVAIPEIGNPSIAAFELAEASTIEAMNADASTIYQAAFFDGTWFGRADFLRRVERASPQPHRTYEVEDTKLALSEKPHFIIQLCFYSEQVERVYGVAPEFMHVLLGSDERRSFRVDEYSAYYRRLKASFLQEIDVLRSGALERRLDEVPPPVAHCAICTWQTRCADLREEREHLSLVARMRSEHIRLFAAADPPIVTMRELADAPESAKPSAISRETFLTLQRQARLQVEQRDGGSPRYELLPPEPLRGLGLLPEPNVGDIFFDMEGDPLFEPGRGLEYLFGIYLSDERRFQAFWGTDPEQEGRAFEQSIDFFMERRRRYPDLHIYHYAPYEKTALRKLSVRHATREAEVDDLLRSEVLVDLYTVARQALCVGQPSYSIKKLELYYGFERTADLRSGDDSVVMFERWLADRSDATLLATIERYNEEDCRSTFALREWFLALRAEAHRRFGSEIPWRPKREPVSLEEERAAALAALSDLQQRLLADAPRIERAEELDRLDVRRRLRWIFAQLLSYHRREDKPTWWKLFDMAEMSSAEQIEHPESLGGLALLDQREPELEKGKRNRTYTYRFPEQEYTVTERMLDPLTMKGAGSIVDIDDIERCVRIRRPGDIELARSLTALIPAPPIDTRAQRASLARIAEALPADPRDARPRCVVDLLLRRPRIHGIPEDGAIQPESAVTTEIVPIVRALDESYLFIQGPPGSGKTMLASVTIATLLREGKRIGIMSTTHKAIQHLLHKVEIAAKDLQISFRALYKIGVDDSYESPLRRSFVTTTTKNADFTEDSCELAAGTSWLFSRDDFGLKLDYLFIEEAGQIALANVVAVAPTAKNLVLLGDPLQLAQVSQGIHPAGMGRSVLAYLLGNDATVPPERGVFLDTSHRMHPKICTFISKHVYAGRLHAAPETEGSRVESPGLSGAGLRYIPVAHEGNARESVEEAERILAEIALLRKGRVRIRAGKERPITDNDILIVTPYNGQRLLLESMLPDAGFPGVRVGTVDKFQGQEAPIVFYSMATSSLEYAPRGIDFLFEKNRFNVAVSRAQCMSILVAGPRLLDLRCSTVEQIAMVNLLCSFVEAATV